MNEQRFRLDRRAVSSNYAVGKVYDNEKQSSLYIQEVVDLLNEQQATIQSLKEENEKLKEELNNLKKDETMLYYYYTLARYGSDGV